MTTFVESTGLQLTVTDVGWAPLATITWGSPYTLYFLMVLVIVNIVMIVLAKTNTIDVDIFDVWHLAFVGLACIYFGANIVVATLLVVFVGVMKIMNSDLMKPTFNDLLGAPEENPHDHDSHELHDEPAGHAAQQDHRQGAPLPR
mgnify:CR=1 FL=1